MNIQDLIGELEKIKKEHGNLDVIVSGTYGASADPETVVFRNDKMYSNEPYVLIETSLCTG